MGIASDRIALRATVYLEMELFASVAVTTAGKEAVSWMCWRRMQDK